jgi:peptidoglycan/LPS O-acetylase OafA/YrhL
MRVTPLLGQLLRSHIVLIGCVLAAYAAAQWCSDLPFYERLLVACVAASLASLALNLFNTGTRRLIFRLPTILNQHVLRKTA